MAALALQAAQGRYRLQSMTLDEMLGLDAQSPSMLRAEALVENDRAFLDALVAARIARGLSQQQVAKLMGVSQPTVADFERHDSNPTLARIRRYAHAIEALIAHRVELDEGQLLDARRSEWVPASTSMRVRSTGQRPEGVNLVSGSRRVPFRNTHASDFALVA